LLSLIFVDCEGIDVLRGTMTEFGAVERETRETFHGNLRHCGVSYDQLAVEVFTSFGKWLSQFKRRPIFVSDNPAYDWQGINYGFLKYLGENPFGHSARRISDFYAGLVGDFRRTQDWKNMRKTPHDHNPVNDAMGNLEAFEEMLRLYALGKLG